MAFKTEITSRGIVQIPFSLETEYNYLISSDTYNQITYYKAVDAKGNIAFGGKYKKGLPSGNSTNLVLVIQAAINALEGLSPSGGYILLNNLALPSGLTYDNTVLICANYGGNRKFYRNNSLLSDVGDIYAPPEGAFNQEADYLIVQNGSDFVAINGSTGDIDFSGPSQNTVVQGAINALVNGGYVVIKDLQIGSVSYGANILICVEYQGTRSFYRNNVLLFELGSLVTTSEISSLVTTTELDTAIAPLVTTTKLDTAIAPLATTSALEAVASEIPTIPTGAYEKDFGYIVRINGSTVQAVNGKTGLVDYSNADAYTVIQSAITAASGGRIFIREGTYTISQTLSSPNTSIEGVYGQTLLILENGVNATLLVLGPTTGESASFLSVKNINLDGNGANQTGTSYGIQVSAIYEPQILSVICQHFLSGALLISGINTSNPTILCWVDKCLFQYNYGDGITFNLYAWDTMLTNNNIGGNVGIGINATGSNDGIKIFGNSIWYNNAGIMIVSTPKFMIDSNEFDSNLVADIHIKNSHHGKISNSEFYGSSQASNGATASIILETDTAISGGVNTQRIKISHNYWFEEPHNLVDINGDTISAGNNQASYCVKEVNTGSSSPNTNLNTIENNDFINYATKPCLIIGDGTRRINNLPETQNNGKNQYVGSGVTTVNQTIFLPEPDTNYIAVVIPYWNTTYWISGKSTNQFTINFGTGPTGASGYDFYLIAMP